MATTRGPKRGTTSRRPDREHARTLQRLRWIVAQAKAPANRGEARVLGTSKAALARALGVSPRALTHYLADPDSADYRAMPDALAGRIADLVDEKLALLKTRRSALAEVEGVEHYRPPRQGLPLKISRYKRPRTVKGERLESEIILVDVHGLRLDDLPEVLIQQWHVLKKTGLRWDVRLLTKIYVEDYFEGGVEQEDIAASIRNRATMSLWLPRYKSERSFIHPFWTDPLQPISIFMESLYAYEQRIPENGPEELAFIPFRPEQRRSIRRRKKAAKRR